MKKLVVVLVCTLAMAVMMVFPVNALASKDQQKGSQENFDSPFLLFNRQPGGFLFIPKNSMDLPRKIPEGRINL